MDVYVLDEAFLRVSPVIDTFESFIWTERFAEFGDFELVIASSVEMKNRLTAGTRLSIAASCRVMTIETVESKNDSDGKSMLTISGRSLESVLDDRVARQVWSDLGFDPTWPLVGTPAAIMRDIFQKICVDGILSPSDVIPLVVPGNFFPTDTIMEPATGVTMELEPTTVYKALKDLGEIHHLGFRLVLNPVTNQLQFNVYAGSNRTTSQTLLPAVIFSPDLDNLEDASELTSMANYKNIAYVFSTNGSEIVYGLGSDPTTAGFERRVLLVKASEVDETLFDADLTAALQQIGRDELSKSRPLFAFDGELPPSTNYPYMVAYNLGDLLEVRNDTGSANYMRVTEQIFVSDSTGERSYPTLVLDSFIIPGTWFSWDYSQVWDDADMFWDDAT